MLLAEWPSIFPLLVSVFISDKDSEGKAHVSQCPFMAGMGHPCVGMGKPGPPHATHQGHLAQPQYMS